jgi:hypothetical protein
MAVLRERPYAQFNFLVDLGTEPRTGRRPASRSAARSG